MSVLPSEMISQFVKETNDSKKFTNTAKSFYGTAVVNSSGIYVRLDGSEALTPVSMATDAKNNDRVLVTIEDHKASITNNITSPASGRSATDLYYVETNENGDIVVKGELRAAKEYVDELIAKNITVSSIEAQSAKIITLEAQQASFENATAENFTAVRAEIENLVIGNLDAKYANIDLANVDTAKIRQGFMETLMVSQGIFTSDITAAEGTFTNYLTGVNILANNITAGTLSVERLIITGSDQSVVYEINKANGTPQLSQTTVDGGSLTERTITADRIVAESITGNEISATTITGQHIVANSITAINLDVNSIFAQDITATGTITGVNLIGATGSFSGNITAATGTIGPWNIGDTSIWKGNSTFGNASGMYFGNAGFSITDKFKVTNTGAVTGTNVSLNGTFESGGDDYDVIIKNGQITLSDGTYSSVINGRYFSLGGDYSSIWNNYNSKTITAEANIFSLLGAFNCTGNVTCNDVIANGWAYVGQVHFKQNSSGNYISIGNYNNAWNNYYYAPGYHAFYCNGNGIAYVQSNGIKMNNYDIMFNLGHGIKYGESEWILRGYKSGDYNVTALGNGNRRTVLYGSQVRLNGSNGTTVTSDRRLKKDFSDFGKRYEEFFMSLKPQTYRMAYTKKSEEYKITNGFVAQDVEKALVNAGLNPEELDMISCDTADQEYLNEMFNGHPPDIQKQYSLNYNNFITLNTYMIQKNRKELNYQSGRIDMQQAIINDLQTRLWRVEKEIKELKRAAQ